MAGQGLFRHKDNKRRDADLHLRLSKRELKALERTSEETGRAVASIVREAIGEWYASRPGIRSLAGKP